jgi:hypothetical protein
MGANPYNPHKYPFSDDEMQRVYFERPTDK